MKTAYLTKDTKISQSDSGFYLTGRNSNEAAKIFKSIEPQLTFHLTTPDRENLSTVINLIAYGANSSDIIRISIYEESWVGWQISIRIGFSQILLAKLVGDKLELEPLYFFIKNQKQNLSQ